MPRLSITLTDAQAAALDAIAAETGATRQSMIGLAVSAWIREQRRAAAALEATTPIYQNLDALNDVRDPYARWEGWARDVQAQRDVERRAFATESEAVEHAKRVARRLRDEGRDAYELWRERA